MRKYDKSIVLIICYYGKFPWYFPYFLHSCKYNPSVKFLIFTDLVYDKDVPENVTFIKKSLKEIEALIYKKTGLAVQIEFPYKLCDLRPAYGVVFADLINGYDFWGYCDIDVIFGKIRNFMKNDVLQHYDVISPRRGYLYGPFTLFRNTPKINVLYKRSEDYEKVFKTAKHYCFDETNFAYDPFISGVPPEKIQTEIESMTHVVKKLNNQQYIRAYFDFHVIDGLPGYLKWVKGVLTYKDKVEAMLYHLVRLKEIYKPKRIGTMPQTLRISRTGIHA